MKHCRISSLCVIGLALLALVSSCATGSFKIKDDNFAASNACDGEGTIELFTEQGELQAKARDDLQTFMRTSGMPSIWCHGLRHVWIGTATLSDYTFESDPNDPLQFIVDRDKGYTYEQGTGTVTTPDGKVVTLP